MTPKEKAEELVKIFNGKELAIMSATLGLETIYQIKFECITLKQLSDHLTYWDEVIEEIEKL
jgi:hypothetical protein